MTWVGWLGILTLVAVASVAVGAVGWLLGFKTGYERAWQDLRDGCSKNFAKSIASSSWIKESLAELRAVESHERKHWN